MRFLSYLVVWFIIGIAAAAFDLPRSVVVLLVAAVLVVSLGSLLYTMFGTQNLKRLEKFIKGQSKNPIYKSLHMVAHGTDEQLRDSLQAILTKYKHTKYEANYGAMLAMMNGDFEEARRYNDKQLQTEAGQYTNFLIDILAGNDVGEVPVFQKPWMNPSIEAHKALMQNDAQTFERTSQQAIHASKGVQYYGNYYTFERMKKRFI